MKDAHLAVPDGPVGRPRRRVEVVDVERREWRDVLEDEVCRRGHQRPRRVRCPRSRGASQTPWIWAASTAGGTDVGLEEHLVVLDPDDGVAVCDETGDERPVAARGAAVRRVADLVGEHRRRGRHDDVHLLEPGEAHPWVGRDPDLRGALGGRPAVAGAPGPPAPAPTSARGCCQRARTCSLGPKIDAHPLCHRRIRAAKASGCLRVALRPEPRSRTPSRGTAAGRRCGSRGGSPATARRAPSSIRAATNTLAAGLRAHTSSASSRSAVVRARTGDWVRSTGTACRSAPSVVDRYPRTSPDRYARPRAVQAVTATPVPTPDRRRLPATRPGSERGTRPPGRRRARSSSSAAR